MAALGGRAPDKVPVMLHNFLMAARENGVSMGLFRRSAKAPAVSAMTMTPPSRDSMMIFFTMVPGSPLFLQ